MLTTGHARDAVEVSIEQMENIKTVNKWKMKNKNKLLEKGLN